MFLHNKPKELDFELSAVTLPDGRLYTVPSGEKYASITTVLGSYSKVHIDAWKERVGEEEAKRVGGLAARRGESLHLICEKYLKNELSDFQIKTMMPNIKQLFIQLRPYFDKSMGTIYALEQPLYSTKMRIAGRVDCIAEWNGVLSVIDFKTSTNEKYEQDIENYFMQCSAYCQMFEDITGIVIEDIVVAIAVEQGHAQVFERKKTKYVPQLQKYIDNFYSTTKLNLL